MILPPAIFHEGRDEGVVNGGIARAGHLNQSRRRPQGNAADPDEGMLKMNIVRRLEALTAVLLLLLLSAACSGVAGSNVGEPTSRARFEFKRKLEALRVGMPADSLEMIFAEARQAGETGILHKTRLVTSDLERVTYSLGWKSDPRHQIGNKNLEDIDVERASVVAENAAIVAITLYD